ncbi:hypothetical protein BG841_00875 [Marinobacter sp. X15-166B]|nr:hypothetical protein BG841_00875 [Marinobacter sp. X15-166B]
MTIVFAGALEKHNGICKLLDAWKVIPDNYELIVYGKGGLKQYVAEIAQSLPNVTYRGYANKDVIHQEMMQSDFNVCFRFSDGIDERFFFPSKFFSVNCYPGFALVNNFSGLPREFQEVGFVINDDMSNIVEVLESKVMDLKKKTVKRQEYLFGNYSWSKLFVNVFNGTNS